MRCFELLLRKMTAQPYFAARNFMF